MGALRAACFLGGDSHPSLASDRVCAGRWPRDRKRHCQRPARELPGRLSCEHEAFTVEIFAQGLGAPGRLQGRCSPTLVASQPAEWVPPRHPIAPVMALSGHFGNFTEGEFVSNNDFRAGIPDDIGIPQLTKLAVNVLP